MAGKARSKQPETAARRGVTAWSPAIMMMDVRAAELALTSARAEASAAALARHRATAPPKPTSMPMVPTSSCVPDRIPTPADAAPILAEVERREAQRRRDSADAAHLATMREADSLVEEFKKNVVAFGRPVMPGRAQATTLEVAEEFAARLRAAKWPARVVRAEPQRYPRGEAPYPWQYPKHVRDHTYNWRVVVREDTSSNA